MDTPRSARESLVEMTEIVLPEDTNAHGTLFGGRVLVLADKCAAVAAMRHARVPVLTLSLDSVEFHNPVRLGDILLLNARLNAVFRSSMEIEVEVRSENPTSGERRLTTRAFVTFVAVNSDGKPIPVRPLLLESDEDRHRFAEASERRQMRLARRNRADSD